MVTSLLHNEDRAALTETSQFDKNKKDTTKRLASILAACTAGVVFSRSLHSWIHVMYVMLVCLADNCFLKRSNARN